MFNGGYISPQQHMLPMSAQAPPVQSLPATHMMSGQSQSPSFAEPASPIDLIMGGTPSNENGKRPASSATGGGSNKKARKAEQASTDDGAGEDDAQGTTEGEPAKAKTARGARACTVCRRLKMRCVEEVPGEPCKRCKAGRFECRFEESNRGKRSSKKSEQFKRTLHKMERTIATVIRSISATNAPSGSGLIPQSRSPSPVDNSPADSSTASSGQRHQDAYFAPKLHTLPDNILNPLGLLAEASLSNNQRSKPSGEEQNPGVGVANDNYFHPGPMTILPLRRLFIERQVQPEMLSFTTTEEVVALFKIFFQHMNPVAPVLDPNWHTPALICSRSPFLLTTICAVASKFYTDKRDLHPRLESLARKLAFTVPERGYKSVEIVQAYLLLALWGSGPTERYEQDKTWMLIGMGIRMATDLNLHRKSRATPQGSALDREARNRERTWIMCFILDRSSAGQLGKPYCISDESMIRNLSSWYNHPLALRTDAGLAAYADAQRVLSRSLEFLHAGYNAASDLQTDTDYLLVVKTIEAQLATWRQQWFEQEKSVVGPGLESGHRATMGRFYLAYMMLVINSFGLQDSLDRSGVDMAHFFERCHSSALALLKVVRDELASTGDLKYSVDSHFVQISYAVVMLLKLLRPEFRQFFQQATVDETISLIKLTPNLLQACAAGPLHTPALYATFLRTLIDAKLNNHASAEGSENGGEMQTSQPQPVSQSQLGLVHSDPQRDVPRTQIPNFLNLPEPSINFEFNGGLPDFQFAGEMGPVADLSTFPPTMADMQHGTFDDDANLMSLDGVLNGGFWDSMLIPGYSDAGLSGGFVFGPGGQSGLITPRLGLSPSASGVNTPTGASGNFMSQHNINSAFLGSG